MTELARGSRDRARLHSRDIDAFLTTAYRNFTPPRFQRKFELFRDVSSEDVDKMELEMMPGFRFSWWYTGAEVTPDPKYKDEQITKHFVRLA